MEERIVKTMDVIRWRGTCRYIKYNCSKIKLIVSVIQENLTTKMFNLHTPPYNHLLSSQVLCWNHVFFNWISYSNCHPFRYMGQLKKEYKRKEDSQETFTCSLTTNWFPSLKIQRLSSEAELKLPHTSNLSTI